MPHTISRVRSEPTYDLPPVMIRTGDPLDGVVFPNGRLTEPGIDHFAGYDYLRDRVTTLLVHVVIETVGKRKTFQQLVSQWHKERGATSSPIEMTTCPAYLRIIGMGQDAIPFIMEQLRSNPEDPDHWFVALESITGEDPIPEEAYGDTVRMAELWLAWSENRDRYGWQLAY